VHIASCTNPAGTKALPTILLLDSLKRRRSVRRLGQKFLTPSVLNDPYETKQFNKRPERMFIAFSSERLAILVWICFHGDFNASTEEVHMNIHSTNRQMLMLCATAAAADHPALLG